MDDTSWIIVDGDGKGQVGRCTRCHTAFSLKLPMNLTAAILYIRAFVEEHRNCKEVCGKCGGTGEVCYSSTNYGPCPECVERNHP